MLNPGLVVVVTEEPAVRKTLTDTLEGEGWVVVPLDDGAELSDFLEFVTEHPDRRVTPRLIVADASVPGPSVFESAAWARLKGLSVPFVFFTASEDENAKDLARALGSVEVVCGSSVDHAREVLHDALAA